MNETQKKILEKFNEKSNTKFENWDALQAHITKVQDANQKGDKEFVNNSEEDVVHDLSLFQKIAQETMQIEQNDENAEVFKAMEESGFKKKFDAADTPEKKAAIYEEMVQRFGNNEGLASLALTGTNFSKMLTAPVSSKANNAEEVEEFRKLNDTFQFGMAVMGGTEFKGTGNDPILSDFKKPLAEFVLRGMEKAGMDVDAYRKGLNEALDTQTTNQGVEFLPTILSADYIDAIFVESQIAGQFRRYTMPSKTWKKPTVTSRGRIYRVPESTANTDFLVNKFTPHQANTDDITFVAEKLGYQALWSDEVSEDSIVDIVDMLQEDLRRSFAEGLDDAVLNGSVLLTDLDNAAAAKLWTSAQDVRNSWDGLRKISAGLSTNTVDGATLSTAMFLLATAQLGGKYGKNPRDLGLAVAPSTYFKMLSLNEVETVDLHGVDRATIREGILQAIYGMNIIMSDELGTNLNASGVYDNLVTSKTTAVLFNKRGFAFGDRKLMTVERDRYVASQQNMLVGFWRGDFQTLYPGENVVSTIINIAN